ncbi:MAG: glycosyltransferase family 4 protein, partial [Bacteroidetes bacterium]|nr:glycosyltransferase family 4 protein [Bacteroidota bacterium]
FYNLIGKGVKGYLSNICALRAFIKKENPDICHAHFSLTGFVTALTFTKKPIIISLMGSDVKASTLLQKALIRIFALFFWSKVIVKSKEMKDILKYKDSIILPNGIDFTRFYYLEKKVCLSRLNWNSEEINILFASNPDRPEKNYKLAEDAISKLGQKKIRIHYLMDIKHEDLVYYYNAADCLLLTSLYEGSPNVIKEAMACSRPIVCTNVGDVKWLLGNEVGHFITSFETKEVIEKLKKAIEFSIAENNTKGRQRILDLGLDSENVALKLIKVYQSVIAC